MTTHRLFDPTLDFAKAVARFLGDAARDLVRLARRSLGVLLIAGLATCALAFATAAASYFAKSLDNAVIRDLVGGTDRAIDVANAHESVLLARAYFYLERDRLDEAQPFADQSRLRSSPDVRADVLYDMANARMRRAIALIEKGDFDKATALVRIAKEEYRETLMGRPDDWNAKYNLDLAMRLVRDFPTGASENEEENEDAPRRLWTDLPGAPRGLP